MLTIFFFLILLLLFVLAVRAKVGFYRNNNAEGAIASPISRALAELVAIAGGIYLSLVLLVNFLKVGLPETVAVGGLRIDPLAVVALLIALGQPLVLNFWPRLKGR